MVEGRSRPAWAEVDLAAVRHNTALLARHVAPAALCAVVKADGYGHGAVPVARAAIDAGAAGLAVALVDEGAELREAGVTAPVLVLSEPPVAAAALVVGAGLTATVTTVAFAAALGGAARRAGTQVPVHVKVDTGMHRVGVAAEDLPSLLSAVTGEGALRLEAVWTHLAVADGDGAEDHAFTAVQLERFEKAIAGIAARPPVLHAANTAGALRWPSARYDMVRCGIGIYGLPPSAAMTVAPGQVNGDRAVQGDGGGGAREVLSTLRPALTLRAKVSEVRELDAGERPSYGRRRALQDRAVVATVPLGYADGVRRGLFDAGCEVLVGGRRRPLAGTVTMDQLVVDCGPSPSVAPGDEVVLLGRQGDAEVTATEWAARLGTICYEVVCGIGSRVARVYTGETAAGWHGWLRP